MRNFRQKLKGRPLISGMVIIYIASLFFLGQRGGNKPLIAHLLVALFCLLLVKGSTGHFWINVVIKRYFYLTVLSFVSLIWAHDIILWYLVCAKIFIVCSGLVILWNYIDTREDILSIAKLFVIGASLLFSYNLLNKDYSLLGFSYGAINTLGPLAFGTLVVGMYLLMSKQYFFAFTIPLSILMIIVSSSQKSTISALLWLFLLFINFIFTRKSVKYKAMYILLTVLLIYGGWKIINMPIFERTGGRTLARTMNTGAKIGLFDKRYNTEEEVAGGRNEYFSDGLRYFLKSPIWGHGINNYRVLVHQETGIYRYSHNTFIELLVGVGSLGVFLFYSLFFLLGKMLIKSNMEYSKKVIFGSFFLVYLFFVGMAQEVTYDPGLFMIVILSMGEIKFGKKLISNNLDSHERL